MLLCTFVYTKDQLQVKGSVLTDCGELDSGIILSECRIVEGTRLELGMRLQLVNTTIQQFNKNYRCRSVERRQVP